MPSHFLQWQHHLLRRIHLWICLVAGFPRQLLTLFLLEFLPFDFCLLSVLFLRVGHQKDFQKSNKVNKFSGKFCTFYSPIIIHGYLILYLMFLLYKWPICSQLLSNNHLFQPTSCNIFFPNHSYPKLLN